MRTIIAGSRKIKSMQVVADAIAESGIEITQVVWGCAPGVDNLGKQWADKNHIDVKPFPAHWEDLTHPDAVIKTNRYGEKYDAKAGLRRNAEMADYAQALIACWNGVSPGTKNMIDEAKKRGLRVFVKIVK